jgi:hypothetical protein
MPFNIKNIRNLSIAKGLLKDRKSAATDELVPIIRQVLKELDVSYNDTCCNDANLGYGGCPQCTGNYASYYDTTEQTVTSGQVAAMKFNTVDISSGITVQNDGSGNPTLITIPTDGIYDIQFSAQAERQQGGGQKTLIIWLRKNGVDVPYTATFIGFVSNGIEQVAAWNYFIDAQAGDEYQLMWSQDDDISLIVLPATAIHPEVPSVILTVNQVG